MEISGLPSGGQVEILPVAPVRPVRDSVFKSNKKLFLKKTDLAYFLLAGVWTDDGPC